MVSEGYRRMWCNVCGENASECVCHNDEQSKEEKVTSFSWKKVFKIASGSLAIHSCFLLTLIFLAREDYLSGVGSLLGWWWCVLNFVKQFEDGLEE